MTHMLKLILISIVLFLTGCAATVQRQGGSDSKLVLSAAAAKRVVMVVQGSKASTSSKDWEQLRAEWGSAMSESSTAAGLSIAYQENVPASSTDAGTLVVVTVNDFRYISQGARFAVGVMTGNAFIDVDVSFFELPSNSPVGTRKYSTSSSGGQGIFAAMTGKQIRSICDEIVKELSQR